MKKRHLTLILAMVFTLACVFIAGCNDSSSKSSVTVDTGSDSNTGNNDTTDNNDNQPATNVPTADGVRRCTLCNDGKTIFTNNPWLWDQYGEKVVYIVKWDRNVYIAGVTETNLVIHNQRYIATGDITPARLNNVFGANFYKFGSAETINPNVSAEIQMIGLMEKVPFLSNLLNPSEVGINEKCGLSYPIDEDNDESIFPEGTLFYKYYPVKNKVKYNKRMPSKVNTFDCQRDLPDTRPESWAMLPLGPRVMTTDGTIAGEIINANPPTRVIVVDDSDDSPGSGDDGSSDSDDGNDDSDDSDDNAGSDDDNTIFTPYIEKTLDCQNDTYLVDPENKNSHNFQDEIEIGTMFTELNIVNAKTGQCKLKLNLKVSAKKIVTIRCWEIFILPGWSMKDGDPVNLNDLKLGVTFSSQYHPKNGGDIDTIWVGVVSSNCYSSYSVGSKNWQSYIDNLTVFVEVNRLHVDGLHKIKLNVRYNNIVYTFDCLRDVEEHRPWSPKVLADYVTGYKWTFQGIPNDAYHDEDTVWVAVSSINKPSCLK